ncbi:MAG: Fic family protein [Atopobiaceae bacterium]|nr:Fic family protein [Atopobiaceae bacterium]
MLEVEPRRAHAPRKALEAAPLLPGAQTAAPEEIPAEVERLLALVADESLALEARGAAAYFAHGAIHPFRDGNGHCGRMLSCAMLAGAYSSATLLALTARLQGNRPEVGNEIRATVDGRKDAERFCRLFLDLLAQGQRDVLTAIRSGAE